MAGGRDAGAELTVSGMNGVSELDAFLRPRLAGALGVGTELVTDDLELATLGLSSLEVMELVYDAEDHLGIVVPEESLASVATVGELIAALEALATAGDVGAGGGR